jgi:hypothetical protein
MNTVKEITEKIKTFEDACVRCTVYADNISAVGIGKSMNECVDVLLAGIGGIVNREQIKREVRERLSREKYAAWETVKELSKEGKLNLLRHVLARSTHDYICIAIKTGAYELGSLPRDQWGMSYLAIKLIPELFLFKPKGALLNGSWFGAITPGSTDKRRQVLKDLIELIETTPEVERGQSNN